MQLKISFALLAAAAFAVFAESTPEQRIVEDTAAALGGRKRIQAVKTLIIEGEATNWNLGQDLNPEATGQTFKITGYKRAIDIAGGRARTEQTRTPNFQFFAGQQAQRQIVGVDGNVGYNVAANGNATRLADTAARDRRIEILHHPLTIIRASLDPAATLANLRTIGNQSVVDITTANGLRLTLAINTATKLPARVVSMSDNANLGDVAIETSFADYQDVDGLRLPMRLTSKTDKWTIAEVRVSKQTVDGNPGDLAAPAAAASAAPITGPPPFTVEATEIGKGVWMLGPGNNSVLVEFGDHLTLIEAQQNDSRALAVIAKARELGRGKPLTQVVNTHFHFDHSGGIRAAVSEGLTIITHKANASFYKDIVARKHTIVPDALARNPKPLKLETVDDVRTLRDNTMTVNVYRVAGTPHVDALLMVYIPRDRLLIEADAYNGTTTVQPFAPNLVENVRKLNLSVDRVVPIHGPITPYSDILKIVQAMSSSARSN